MKNKSDTILAFMILGLSGLLVISCRAGARSAPDSAPEAAAPTIQDPLPDGIYAVLEARENVETLLPEKEGERVIANLRKLSEEKTKEPAEFLVVRKVPDVPLQLAAEPQQVETGSGKTTLQLELTSELAGHLEKLTLQMSGARVAVIIGGEVVTTHKIRAPVSDGRLQISCCAAGACEYLLGQLKDNIKAM